MLQRALDRAQGAAVDAAVSGGGVELLVAEQHLDEADVDFPFQEVSGEAVPQGMQIYRLVDAGGLPGAMEVSVRSGRGISAGVSIRPGRF